MAREYSIGVAFRLPMSILNMVDELVEKEETNRSQVLLQIVKEHFGSKILKKEKSLVVGGGQVMNDG